MRQSQAISKLDLKNKKARAELGPHSLVSSLSRAVKRGLVEA